MPPPIVPAPITPTRLIVARLRVLGQAVDLRGLALGEEEILLGARLGAGHQLHEQPALVEHALGIGLGDRRLDRRILYSGASKPLNLRALALRNSSKMAGIGARLGELVVALAGLRDRPDVAAPPRRRRPHAARGRPRSAGRRGRSHRPPSRRSDCRSRPSPAPCATPATRGSRWVPPAPGSRPSFTSGTPSFADGTATR